MGDVLLVEIQATPPMGDAVTLRFADRAIRPLPPTDGLRPNAGFDSRLEEAPAIRRALFEDLATLRPALGVGALTLKNADRGLDAYQGHLWGEMTVRMWAEGTAFMDSEVVLAGTCGPTGYARPSGQPAKVKVPLYDYAAEASKPLQGTLYAGTNGVGGVLYEGDAETLKGQPKPFALGDLTTAQIAAPLVNSGDQVWQLHEGQVQGTEAVFDRGDDAGLVGDGDFAGAAFDAHVPAAAHYCTDLGRGLLKGTFAPVGQVTFGYKAAAADGYVETAGPMLARLLAKAGVPDQRVGPSVAALASARVMGLYVQDTSSLSDAIALVEAGVPASVIPDRTGVWQAIPYGPAADVADVEVSEHQVIDCSADESAPLPAAEIRVGWGRVYRTFGSAELAPDLVGTDEEARLKDEYRWASAVDAALKAQPASNWRTVTLPTALRVRADAEALAASLLELLGRKVDGSPRRMWRVIVEREVAAAQELGQTVALSYPPQGIDGNFLLVAEEPLRPRRGQTIWTLWG